MTAKQPAVKKYIVKLTAEERNRLNALIQKGKSRSPSGAEGTHPAEGRCLEAGEAWSDSRIAAALDTSIDTIARTRQQLVEEGMDAALTRKHSPNSARKRIFDGVAEAKLIALGLFFAAQGSQAVDIEADGDRGGGAEHCRSRQ